MNESQVTALAPNISDELFLWRPIGEGMATYDDLDRLPLSAFADMNEYLDLRAAAQKKAYER